MRRCLAVLIALAAACSRKEATPAAPAPAVSAVSAVSAAAVPSASPSTTTPAGSGAPFAAACTGDRDCASGVCFHKRIKTPDAGREERNRANEPVEHDGYCSMRCNDDADCPVPLTRGKCGARGMCKKPES